MAAPGAAQTATRHIASMSALHWLVGYGSLLYSELYVWRLGHMDTLTYSEARSKLANTMDRVCDDHAPIIITRKNSQSVVMMSLADFQALEETAYLLRSPKNAKRLIESIVELKSGGGTSRKLIE